MYYIGWVHRFAAPAYTQHQKDIAAKNHLRSIYTPQAVLDGKDWPRWGGKPESREPAKAAIAFKQTGNDPFDASVVPTSPGVNWCRPENTKRAIQRHKSLCCAASPPRPATCARSIWWYLVPKQAKSCGG